MGVLQDVATDPVVEGGGGPGRFRAGLTGGRVIVNGWHGWVGTITGVVSITVAALPAPCATQNSAEPDMSSAPPLVMSSTPPLTSLAAELLK